MLSRRFRDPFALSTLDPLLNQDVFDWDPFRTSMDEFLGMARPGMSRGIAGTLEPSFGARTRSDIEWAPRTDIFETKDSYKICSELPGMKKEDINIEVDEKGKHLTLSGESKKETKEEGENYHRVERSFGRFRRRFRLPDNVNPDDVQAKMQNGVLNISLPKKKGEGDKEEKKKIDIQ